MKSSQTRPSPRNRSWLTLFLALGGLALAMALAHRLRTVSPPGPRSFVPLVPASSKLLWSKSELNPTARVHPRVTNVQIVDFDKDGTNEILVCDAGRSAVLLYRQTSAGRWEERTLGTELSAPAHATMVDLDGDGDQDVVVAILGNLLPSDEMIGKVVLLRNDGGRFVQQVLLDDVYRVADVQAGDLDGDGDVDLAVAVFGYAHGEVLWLEQRGPLEFRDHHLLDRPGAIHVPMGDFDQDGDLDIATIVSQDEEELWGLENLGGGKFRPKRLWFTHNFDAGSGGLVATDLDRDGDLDFLLPLGDNLEHGYGWPQPYHGCLWFENLGGWKFQEHRIARFGGTYAAAAGDFDGDGDMDVALVSMSNDWNNREHPSVVWLENDGHQNFQMWKVDTAPVALITVACGDLNRDGRADVVAGGLELPTSPLPRELARITTWISRPK